VPVALAEHAALRWAHQAGWHSFQQGASLVQAPAELEPGRIVQDRCGHRAPDYFAAQPAYLRFANFDLVLMTMSAALKQYSEPLQTAIRCTTEPIEIRPGSAKQVASVS